jgi:hypothetical protein
MKSPQKKTLAKKRKPSKKNMAESSFTDDIITISSSDNTLDTISPITIDLGQYTGSAGATVGGTVTSSPYYGTGTTYTIGTGTTTIGTGTGYTYNPVQWTTTGTGISNGNGTVKITGDGLDLDADADIKIGKKSLKEFMDKMEERLAILYSRPDLEEKWDKLRDLKKQYDDMVKDIEEKQKLMDILKRD